MAENNEPVSFLDLAIVMKYIDPNMNLSEAQKWVSELKKCLSEMLNRECSTIAFIDEEALSNGLNQPGTAKEKIQAAIDYEKSHPSANKGYCVSNYTSPCQIVNELHKAMKGNRNYWKDAKSTNDCDISALTPDEELLAAQTFMFRNKHYNVSDEEALRVFRKAIGYLKGEECTSTEFIECYRSELTDIIQCLNQHYTEESINIFGFKIAKKVMDKINQGKEPPKPDGFLYSWNLYLLSEVYCLWSYYTRREELFRNRSDDYIMPAWGDVELTSYPWYIFCAQGKQSKKQYYALQLKKAVTIRGVFYEFEWDFSVSGDLTLLKEFQNAKINGQCYAEFQGTSAYCWSREGRPPAHPYFTLAQLYLGNYIRSLNYLQDKCVTDKEALKVCCQEMPALNENKEEEKPADPVLKKTFTWFLNKPGNALNDFPELRDYSEGQAFSDYLTPSTEPLQTEGFIYEWSREEHESTHKNFTLIYRARPTCERVPEVIAEENRIRLDYWQYIKEFVFFGGSHLEGGVLAPDPAWIDEAHKNGVGIFGTVFLAPEAFGGDLNDTKELAKPETLQKLVDIAHQLNFEGWFLNVERQTELLLYELKSSIEKMDLKGKQFIWYLPRFTQRFDPKTEGVTMTCDDEIDNIAYAFMEEQGKKLYLDFGQLPFLTRAPQKYILFADEPYWQNKLEDRGYLVKPGRFLNAQNCLWQLFLGENGLKRKPDNEHPWYGIAKYAKERKQLTKD